MRKTKQILVMFRITQICQKHGFIIHLKEIDKGLEIKSHGAYIPEELLVENCCCKEGKTGG